MSSADPWLRRVGSALRGARSVPRTRFTARGVWAPSPASFLVLVGGLTLFGVGEGLLLRANLGAAPWSVLSQGLSLHTGLSIGWTTFIISTVVLLLWIPLKQRPGLGTVMNIIVIAAALEVTYSILTTPDSLLIRYAMVAVGIAAIGLGSGLYLTCGHGPGPRDGWMTGMHRVTGWPVGRVRLVIEVVVLTLGWLLGGTVGIGTALFALLIGQSVAMGLGLVHRAFPGPIEPTPDDEPLFPQGDA